MVKELYLKLKLTGLHSTNYLILQELPMESIRWFSYFGTGYSDLVDFSGSTDGSSPLGELFYTGGSIYGMTTSGGASNMGVLFKYTLPIGITENNADNVFNIFPNPNNGIINIEKKQNNNLFPGSYLLTIYNVLGEEVYSKISDPFNTTIDFKDQPNGTYFLYIKTENSIMSTKIILNK